MPPKPDVDVEKCAGEVKAYLDREKYNLIDSDSTGIEAWPRPDDPEMPEMGRLREQHEEFFAFAAGLEIDDDGKGCPTELREEFQSVVKRIKEAVNSDMGFWARLREEVIPLYGKVRFTRHKDGKTTFTNLDDGKKSPWSKRWKSIDLFYDPFGMGVKVDMKYKNLRTGEVKEGSEKQITDRSIPAGFVIRVL